MLTIKYTALKATFLPVQAITHQRKKNITKQKKKWHGWSQTVACHGCTIIYPHYPLPTNLISSSLYLFCCDHLQLLKQIIGKRVREPLAGTQQSHVYCFQHYPWMQNYIIFTRTIQAQWEEAPSVPFLILITQGWTFSFFIVRIICICLRCFQSHLIPHYVELHYFLTLFLPWTKLSRFMLQLDRGFDRVKEMKREIEVLWVCFYFLVISPNSSTA